MDNTCIVEQLKNGDIEAFSNAFNLYYVQLCQYAHSILQDKNLAEDAVQDSFARLCSKQELWDRINDVRGYLYTTVRNRCMVIIRQKCRNDRLIVQYCHILARYDHHGPWQENSEQVTIISRIISRLPLQRQKAVSLVYVRGKSYKQAANILGVTIDTIKTHLSLAKKNIRLSLTGKILLILICLQLAIGQLSTILHRSMLA